MNVVLIAGLPGSGKTHLAHQYADRGYRMLDDLRSTNDLAESLYAGHDVVVTDPNFCLSTTRNLAETWILDHFPLADVTWVFFENAPDKCRRNVAHRNAAGDSRAVEGSIRRFAKVYDPPADALPVWQPA